MASELPVLSEAANRDVLMTPADLIQNDALSAAILAQAVHSFGGRDKGGMPLLLCTTILPLVLHGQSSQQINRRRGDSALFRVAEENPRVSAGLEARVKAMMQQTFDALNVALATNCVVMESETRNLLPGSDLFPIDAGKPEVRAKLRAANRLGRWFAVVGLPQTYALLNLRM
jgi:hypothetical protein